MLKTVICFVNWKLNIIKHNNIQMRVFGYTNQGQTDICDDIFREKIYHTIKNS